MKLNSEWTGILIGLVIVLIVIALAGCGGPYAGDPYPCSQYRGEFICYSPSDPPPGLCWDAWERRYSYCRPVNTF